MSVCVITGTPHGIGFETAREVASRGKPVIMLNRDADRGKQAARKIREDTSNPQVANLQCDLARLRSVRHCAEAILRDHESVDILVNNAGIMNGSLEYSSDGIELTFAVNHLGPFLLTNLLMPALLNSEQARVVNIASSVHTLGRLNFKELNSTRYGTMRAYARSKLANVMCTLKLAEDYAHTSITANCIHPGVVATNLLPANRPLLRGGGKLVRRVMRTPAQSASAVAYLALSEELSNITGKYFSPTKRIRKPSRAARNRTAQAQLWSASEKLTGLA